MAIGCISKMFIALSLACSFFSASYSWSAKLAFSEAMIEGQWSNAK